MHDDLNNLQQKYNKEINSSKTLKELDEVFLELFGKTGEITLFSKNFSGVSKEELKEIVPLFNKVKIELEKEIGDKRNGIREEAYRKLEDEKLDFIGPERRRPDPQRR